jgi:phage tail P2-like protein
MGAWRVNKLDTITMRGLLPPNFADRPEAIAASKAIALEYQRVYKTASRVLVFADISKIPEQWLDLYAVDMHVDYYDFDLPLPQKQELVRQSIKIHKEKGTAWAVQKIAEIAFGAAYTKEWFEYGGDPYYFKIYTSNPLATPEVARKFRLALETVKNVRSWLEGIIRHQISRAPVPVAVRPVRTRVIRVQPYRLDVAGGTVAAGAAVRPSRARHISIPPKGDT